MLASAASGPSRRQVCSPCGTHGKARQRGQISGGFRQPGLFQQGRAGHQTLAAIGEHAQYQFAVFQGWRPHANSDIDIFADHIHTPVGGFHIERHARVAHQVGGEHISHPWFAQRHGAGHAHDAMGLGLPERDRLVDCIRFHQHCLAVAE